MDQGNQGLAGEVLAKILSDRERVEKGLGTEKTRVIYGALTRGLEALPDINKDSIQLWTDKNSKLSRHQQRNWRTVNYIILSARKDQAGRIEWNITQQPTVMKKDMDMEAMGWWKCLPS